MKQPIIAAGDNNNTDPTATTTSSTRILLEHWITVNSISNLSRLVTTIKRKLGEHSNSLKDHAILSLVVPKLVAKNAPLLYPSVVQYTHFVPKTLSSFPVTEHH